MYLTGSLNYVDENILIKQVTYKEQQTLVLPDGSTAAQESQQEEHAPHGQDDVDPREEQRVGRNYLPKSHWVHQHPYPHSQQKGAT